MRSDIRATVAFELRLDPVVGRLVARCALAAVAELRQGFDRGFVTFEIEPRDKRRDWVLVWYLRRLTITRLLRCGKRCDGTTHERDDDDAQTHSDSNKNVWHHRQTCRCFERRSTAHYPASMKPLPLALLLLAFVAVPTMHAETHRLAPSVFVNTYSAAHVPVLRIKSGDRVVTAVVDDTGVDARGTTVAQGPNPQTGPFFIEGAEPGDLLVVTIEKLQPNRATGTSAALMNGASIEPDRSRAAVTTRV